MLWYCYAIGTRKDQSRTLSVVSWNAGRRRPGPDLENRGKCRMKIVKKLLIPILIVMIAAAGWFYMKNRGDDGLPVETVAPVKADVSSTVSVSGEMLAADGEVVDLAQNLLLETVEVREGDRVTAGQVLATGDPSDLVRKREKLLLQKADLESRRAEAVDPSLNASAAGIRSQVEQARSQVALQKQKLADAEAELARLRNLLEAGAVSKSEVEAQEQKIREIGIQLEIAQAQLASAMSQQGDIPTDRELQAADLDIQIEQVDKDIAQVDSDIADLTYRASLSGTVTRVTPVAGRKTGTGDFIRIDDLSSYRVEALVPQEDAVMLGDGQVASVTMKGGATSWPAAVVSVAKYASVDSASGSTAPRVRVVLALDPIAEGEAAPVVGFEADAIVVTGVTTGEWTLPRESVRTDLDGTTFVWIVSQSTAARKAVEVLRSDDEKSALKGLDGSETVIALPVDGIAEGVALAPTARDAIGSGAGSGEVAK